jgi:hypothetical protein
MTVCQREKWPTFIMISNSRVFAALDLTKAGTIFWQHSVDGRHIAFGVNFLAHHIIIYSYGPSQISSLDTIVKDRMSPA